MAQECREWPINFGDGGYVALYRYDGNDAVILAVRHQKEAGFRTAEI
ncbi:MAG: type II toxin-antitoxin system RelE/ParE family toxin [Sulfuricella sp.]